MVFLETTVFTRRIVQLLTDDDYSALQNYLVLHPEEGKVIRGSGGLRKIRWAREGGGKSSGVRTIDYWAKAKDQILMVFAFAKNEADNLTARQVQQLKAVVEEEYP